MDATIISNLEPYLTIHSKPNLEKNDVSKQVGKPIYVVTQINDS